MNLLKDGLVMGESPRWHDGRLQTMTPPDERDTDPTHPAPVGLPIVNVIPPSP